MTRGSPSAGGSLLLALLALFSWGGDADRSEHNLEHFGQYHRARDVLLDYGDGTEVLTYDDLAFGYETMINDPRNGFEDSFKFFGISSQQDPMDVIILQELFADLRPDLVVELGTFCGGGALLFAHMLTLLGVQGAKVLTIDPYDQRKNRASPCFESSPNFDAAHGYNHPLWDVYVERGTIVKVLVPALGDAQKYDEAAREVSKIVARYASKAKTVFVSEDSAHEKSMVLRNAKILAPFVSVGSYLLVQDTRLDRDCEMGNRTKVPNYEDYTRPKKPFCKWYIHNGPAAAVAELFRDDATFRDHFIVDRKPEKYILTQHPGGWLKRIS
ncbi:hypothetical protein M885DRAFT_512847 [Pelagophyceae sp. CCMP2097]|nr:hypothetical protein M885DRAFT_512847 [Pelagophyceae sp. CCMP2097]